MINIAANISALIGLAVLQSISISQSPVRIAGTVV